MDGTPLYTIGHGRRRIDDFISLLKEYKIEYLIDVRTTPFSRFNPQYNRKILSLSVEQENIRYVFMGESLGGRPSDPDCYTDGKINYGELMQKNFFQVGISRLKMAYQNQNRIAIMCSESDPRTCHRSKLIAAVLYTMDIPVVHIDQSGKLLRHTEL